jgi:hypothetical protein
MGYALFIPESFSRWDADGVACWQQAGEECAESEKRGGCEETTRGKALCIQWARTAPGKLSTATPMTMPAAALTSATRAAAHSTCVRGGPQRQADAELRRALRDADN